MKERPRKPAGRPGKGQPPAQPKQKEQEKGPKPTKNPEGLPGPALRLNQRRLKTALVGDKSSPPKRSRRPLEQPKGTTPQPSPPQKAKPQPAPKAAITGSWARPDRTTPPAAFPTIHPTLTEYSSDFEGIPASRLSHVRCPVYPLSNL